jgi:hypothetical protein
VQVNASRGRWVVVLEEGGTPIFWSYDRESLTAMFMSIRSVCPEAQLKWESPTEPDHGERSTGDGSPEGK